MFGRPPSTFQGSLRKLKRDISSLYQFQQKHGRQILAGAGIAADIYYGGTTGIPSALIRAATFPRAGYTAPTYRYKKRYSRIKPSRAYRYRQRYRKRGLRALKFASRRRYRYRKFPSTKTRYSRISKRRRYKRYTATTYRHF